MREETIFSILNAKDNPEYDKACKDYFRNREAIAPILKAVVSEYKDYSIEDIVRFIDADSIEEEKAISDLPPRIKDAGTEQALVYEKTIYYDVHFKSLNPLLSDKKISVELHIDFEVQNSYRPSNPRYPVIKRGIYYAAREISSQLGILTEKTNYADLSKVYSIWVCNHDIPQKLQNTITRYYLKKEDLVGMTEEPEKEYDLMEVVIIRRGSEAPEENDVLQYLEGVFTSDMEKMRKYVDMPEGSRIEEEARKMSGLGQSLYMDGVQQGIQQGMQQGIQQGIQQGTQKGIEKGKVMGMVEGVLTSLKNLMKNANMTQEQAMIALGIPENERSMYQDKLSKL